MLKIGLDVDDVLAEFLDTYLERFGHPKSDCEITWNVFNVLRKDKQFWEGLPVVNRINFIPELYCTKRVNSKRYTKNWLRNNGFPNRPIYQMYYQHGNKADMIKGKIDVFVDDSVSNFVKMNLSGVPCLLLDKEYNQDWGPVGRIYCLDYEHIKESYELLMEIDFKKLVA